MIHDIMGLDRALPWLAASFFGGYLLGSIPFGVVIAWALGLGDLRKIGSGNIGATNVLRTGNKGAAAATLILDAGKGAAAVLVFGYFWGPDPAQLAGIGAFLGHLYPVWLKFKGGKGVATFLGIVLALHWPSGLAACAVWLAVALVFRISSLSALVAAAATPVVLYLLHEKGLVLGVALLAALVWVKHAPNILRLLRGEEPRIGFGKKS
jgi:glycerol-3-phosphate acyltransferase PlsY